MSLSTLIFIAAMVLMLFMHLRHGGHGGGHGSGCHGGHQHRPKEDGEASKEDGGDGTA